MYCPTCGTLNDDNNFRCIQCGNIIQFAPSSAPSNAGYGDAYPESSSATLALILSVVGWAACGIFTSIPGLIIAKGEIRAIENGSRDPRNLSTAKAAFWLGAINIGITILVIGFYIVLFAIVGVSSF